MGDTEHWICPYCNHAATLRDDDRHVDGKHLIKQDPIEGHKYIQWRYIVCPNPDCRKFALSLSLFDMVPQGGGWRITKHVHAWKLVPPSNARAFPGYIPQAILDDYNEACLIADLSPKASATLSRRCLQGIIRDFWRVKPGRLVDEIEEIKDKVDPDTWKAIDSVRKLGNIGAHMEKDINLIVDVEPNEAALLIGLIETLLKDWYVVREERKNRLQQIKAMADQKDAARKDENAEE